MKQGWEYKKLGEVCCPKKDIKRANKCFQKDDAIRYIDISSVDNTSNTIASYSDYIFQNAPSRAQQVVENGDIVLSLVRPNLKNIAIVKDCYENMVASSGFCVLRVNGIIDNRYLFYIVTSPTYTEYLLKNVSGANYPAVTEDIVKTWEFPFPPLSQQQTIVAELDKINEIIDLKKAQLKDLDLLAQSIFYDMFGDPIENPKGWEKKKWKDVFKTTTGKLDSNAMEEDGIYPFFTCAKEVFRINTYAFDCEALLLAGNNAAGVYDVKHYKGKFNAYQRTYVITLSDNNNLYCIFKAQLEEKLQYLKSQSLGCNTKYLTLKILNSLDFIVPPLTLQQSFAEKIQAIESQKSAIKQSLADAETLLASRMDYWFG